MRGISKISVELVQDGNTLGTTSEFEHITIECQYQIPGEEPFFVIRTDGWSEDGEELYKVLDELKRFSNTINREVFGHD